MKQSNHFHLPLVAFALFALAASVNAAVIFTEDFEAVSIADGGFTSAWPTPTWTMSSGSVSNVLDPASGSSWLDPVPALIGEQFGMLHSSGTATTDLAAVYQANSTYTLSFTHFRRDDIGGDAILAQLMTMGGVVVTGTEFTAVTTTGTFETRTITFDTGSDPTFNGETIRIRFTDPNGNSGGSAQSGIDNISLSVVPEPSIALFLVSGLLFTLMRRRR